MNPKDLGVSPEELAEEANLQKAASAKAEEIKAQVIEKYGLDPVDNETLIEKLVADRLEDQKKFGKVVGQKIDWREKALKGPPAPKIEEPKTPPTDPNEILEKAKNEVRSEFEKRDLDSLELPDDIKEEVKKIARAQNISVLQAAKDPYIQFKKDAYETQRKTEEAAISRSNKTAVNSGTFTLDAPPQVDMSTPEGRKTWDDYMEWAKKQNPGG